MSAVQFIFRGEACWRGGEEFREGFNLSAWIWGRAAARFEPGFPSSCTWCPFLPIKGAFPFAALQILLGKREMHQHPPFCWESQVETRRVFFNTWYSFKLSSINLTPSSVFYWVPHRLPYSLRVLLSQYFTCYLLNVCCSLSPKFMALFL